MIWSATSWPAVTCRTGVAELRRPRGPRRHREELTARSGQAIDRGGRPPVLHDRSNSSGVADRRSRRRAGHGVAGLDHELRDDPVEPPRRRVVAGQHHEVVDRVRGRAWSSATSPLVGDRGGVGRRVRCRSAGAERRSWCARRSRRPRARRLVWRRRGRSGARRPWSRGVGPSSSSPSAGAAERHRQPRPPPDAAEIRRFRCGLLDGAASAPSRPPSRPALLDVHACRCPWGGPPMYREALRAGAPRPPNPGDHSRSEPNVGPSCRGGPRRPDHGRTQMDQGRKDEDHDLVRDGRGRDPAAFAAQGPALSLDDVERQSGAGWCASAIGAYERGFRNLSLPRLRELAEFYDVPCRSCSASAPPGLVSTSRRSRVPERSVSGVRSIIVERPTTTAGAAHHPRDQPRSGATCRRSSGAGDYNGLGALRRRARPSACCTSTSPASPQPLRVGRPGRLTPRGSQRVRRAPRRR